MERKTRRKHSDEFKRGAVEMVTQQGYTVARAAKALNLHGTLLRSWLDRLAPDWRTQRAELVGDAESDDPRVLRERLRRLERANAELRLERDILKKATAYFAKESL